MNHPTEDELLLLAYGELPDLRAAEIDSHAAACRMCQEKLAQLERGRVALNIAVPAGRRKAIVWATLALAAAAGLAGMLIIKSGPSRDPGARWTSTTTRCEPSGRITTTARRPARSSLS